MPRKQWLVVDDSPPKAECRVKRGPRSKTTCELPPGHDHAHLGRSPSGRWFGWEAEPMTCCQRIARMYGIDP